MVGVRAVRRDADSCIERGRCCPDDEGEGYRSWVIDECAASSLQFEFEKMDKSGSRVRALRKSWKQSRRAALVRPSESKEPRGANKN